MEFGIFTWFGYKRPFSEIIELIREAGFHSVMIWWGDEEDEFTVPKKQQPDIVRKAGLKVDNAHLTFERINALWEDILEGQEIFEKYRGFIDDCKSHEIPTAVMHATTGDSPPPFCLLGLDRFRRLTERAEKNGVTIALENVRRPEYVDNLFGNIDSDRLKFCYDCGHENCFTSGIDFLSKYGDRLAALHLHDNDGTCDQHLPPFNGTVNWKRIMAALKKLGYTGPLAFEIDAQFKDFSKEVTAAGYLADAMNRIRKVERL